MKNQQTGYRRRQQARNQQELPGNFVPAMGIIRRVSPADFDIAEAQERIAKKLAKQYPRLAKNYKIVPAEDLHLTVMEQRELVYRFRSTGVSPRPKDMRRVAYDIRDGLAEQIAADEGPLTLALGQLAVFGKNNILGTHVGPRNWRSASTRYACREEGRRTPIGVLIEESEFCRSVLQRHFSPRYPRFSAQDINRPSHISLLKKCGGTMYDREAHQVIRSIVDMLPETVTFEDPVIQLRTTRTGEAEIIPVIEPSERFLQLAGATATLPLLEVA
jgi:hypothetical protein